MAEQEPPRKNIDPRLAPVSFCCGRPRNVSFPGTPAVNLQSGRTTPKAIPIDREKMQKLSQKCNLGKTTCQIFFFLAQFCILPDSLP